MKPSKVVEEKKEYPLCLHCNQAMVWSFALRGCEFVCAPCGYGVPMFNGCKKAMRSIKYMNRKKKLWSKDLSVVGRRISGASCAVCDDGSCEWCKRANDKNYKFEYWGINTKE